MVLLTPLKLTNTLEERKNLFLNIGFSILQQDENKIIITTTTDLIERWTVVSIN